MKICAVADVHMNEHGRHSLATPAADVLVVAGDLTLRGRPLELYRFRDWLVEQPQKHKVVIAGNHDFCLEKKTQQQDSELTLSGDGIVYLRDQEITIDGVRFWGTPWQPWFHDWAFNLRRGEEIRKKWDLIPDGIDVLVTHGPPFGYGDLVSDGERVGCEDLIKAVDRVKPKLHFFGHIHEDVGEWHRSHSDGAVTKIVNCSVGPIYDWHGTNSQGTPRLFEIVK